MQVAIWEDETAWREARYSPAYVEYLKASLLPPQHTTESLRRGQEALWETPIVKVILAHQAQDSSWPLGGPPWFRIYPRPLLVLLEYGMVDHPAVRRGVKYLLSTVDQNKFAWPRAEPYDPNDFYIRHQGACLQVVGKAGLAVDPRAQAVAHRLVGTQREDGGWSTQPDWMYGEGEAKTEPRPSCWICTLDVMGGLGMTASLPRHVVDGTLRFWTARLKPNDSLGASLPGIRGWAVATGGSRVGLILACMEFCANQRLQADHPFVRHLLDLLNAARGADGLIPGLSGYFDVMAAHLEQRVHAR